MIRKEYYNVLRNNDIKIILFSDIHYSDLSFEKKFKNIIASVKKESPDYICIPGDIIDKLNYVRKDEIMLKLYSFLEELGKICPVIASVGNHDMYYKDKIKREILFNLLYENINKIENVHLLNNEFIKFDNINFYGLTQDHGTYRRSNKSAFLQIKEKIDKINDNDFNDNINCLLLHSPITFEYEEFKDNLRKFDIVLCGHMHNGAIPIGLDKLLKTNKGLIYPNKKLFPKYARGHIKFDNDVDVFISKGITTFSKTAKMFQIFNFLYPSNIEVINIEKAENEKEKVKNRIRR